MNTLDAIFTRRSIRHFTDKKVSKEDIETILKAAMYAPSAGNQRPWHFIVITDQDILSEIPTIHPYAQMVRESAFSILVCGDLSLQSHEGYWMLDCAASVQNLLLAAHELGFGAVWTGVYPRENRIDGIRSLIKLPENVIPFALVPIGYPAETKELPNRFEESRVHFNKWNNKID